MAALRSAGHGDPARPSISGQGPASRPSGSGLRGLAVLVLTCSCRISRLSTAQIAARRDAARRRAGGNRRASGSRPVRVSSSTYRQALTLKPWWIRRLGSQRSPGARASNCADATAIQPIARPPCGDLRQRLGVVGSASPSVLAATAPSDGDEVQLAAERSSRLISGDRVVLPSAALRLAAVDADKTEVPVTNPTPNGSKHEPAGSSTARKAVRCTVCASRPSRSVMVGMDIGGPRSFTRISRCVAPRGPPVEWDPGGASQ